MRGAVLFGPRDVRYVDREDPEILEPTDAIIRIVGHLRVRVGPVALPRHRADNGPTPMGHEYCGIVEEVGRAVTSIKPGQFVIGSFFASDNTCPNCRRATRPRACTRALGAARRRRCCACRSRTARWSPRRSFPPDDLVPEPAGGLRRARHRLVRARTRPNVKPGQDGRGCR